MKSNVRENLPLVEPSPETFCQHQRGGQRGSHLLPPTEKLDEVLVGFCSSNLVDGAKLLNS